MCASREKQSLWLAIKFYPIRLFFGYNKYLKKWEKPYIFTLIKSPYFWHDTFGVYFNRYILCKIRGHKKVEQLTGCNGEKYLYCFDCEQKIILDCMLLNKITKILLENIIADCKTCIHKENCEHTFCNYAPDEKECMYIAKEILKVLEEELK